MRKVLLVSSVLAFLLAAAPGAWAHGDLRRSNPEEGERVDRAPRVITLTLAEPPGPGSTLKVSDGCRRKVAATVQRTGSDLEARLSGGQPGHWMVKYQSVSSVDGHIVKGWVHFRVAGKKDCSPGSDESPPDDTEIGGGEDTRVANPDPPNEGGGFPIVGLGIGTVVLVGIALMLRRSTA